MTMWTQKLRSFVSTSLLLATVTSFAAAETDLSGMYDVGTLTPLERPTMYGDKLFLTPEEAKVIETQFAARVQRANASSDPNRSAPESGGKVGGYNMFWLDIGESAANIDGRFRTSILTAPSDGRIPAMTEFGRSRMAQLQAQWRLLWRSQDLAASKNTGTAWWLDNSDGRGPYDDIEQRPLAERCIVGSRSTAGPPMLPNIYNNHKRIVQTPNYVMILTEMNHDARIIRLNGEPKSEKLSSWLGDSVGYWEGGTLIVETANFGEFPALSGANENLKVKEFFSRRADGGLLYRFEVDNPDVWSKPWAGEYSWTPSNGKLYEVACHEGNYALGNILRGARLLEQDASPAAD